MVGTPRPYRVTWTWDDGRKGRDSHRTRKAAEERKTELQGIAKAMREGGFLLATSNGSPVDPGPGEVVEHHPQHGWIKKRPATTVSVRITKRRPS